MIRFSILVCLVVSVYSQTTVTTELNGDHAMVMFSLITGQAKASSTAVSICIRDKGDNVVGHLRMKNALLGSVQLSCQKARSSALFGAPSVLFKQFPGIELSNEIISNLQGALPLTSAGVLIGSVGVSGAMTGEEDEALAKVAVDNLDYILANYS